jgi:restriction system protein
LSLVLPLWITTTIVRTKTEIDMTLWLVRAGANGEYESKFSEDQQIFLTWDDLRINLAGLKERHELVTLLGNLYPDDSLPRRRNHASQIWPFAHAMQKGDWVVLPRKTDRTICIGEITGDYEFHDHALAPFFHSRRVKWLEEGIPRNHFGQDLLDSFGAFMTICRIERNSAAERLQAMSRKNWAAESLADVMRPASDKATAAIMPADEARDDDSSAELDLAEIGQDRISRLIMARFKNHGLTRLVEAILQAQGYSTYRSPEGPDGGIDILAGSGHLGFGEPRLCVQVKSHVDKKADIKDYNELRGAMQTAGATQGLYVSWAGYTNAVQQQARSSFFHVRLWTQTELFAALFEAYDRLPADIRADLPLVRIWSVKADASS